MLSQPYRPGPHCSPPLSLVQSQSWYIILFSVYNSFCLVRFGQIGRVPCLLRSMNDPWMHFFPESRLEKVRNSQCQSCQMGALCCPQPTFGSSFNTSETNHKTLYKQPKTWCPFIRSQQNIDNRLGQVPALPCPCLYFVSRACKSQASGIYFSPPMLHDLKRL